MSVTKGYFRLFLSPGFEKTLQQLCGPFFDLQLTAELHIASTEPAFLPHPSPQKLNHTLMPRTFIFIIEII